MYKIKVNYKTGDSFHNEDVEKVLDISWKNADVAKQNLIRIKEHYEWAERDGSMPEFLNESKDKWKDKWYFPLLDDNGKEVEICASWVGYFECLHSASIVSDPEDGWSFEF